MQCETLVLGAGIVVFAVHCTCRLWAVRWYWSTVQRLAAAPATAMLA